MNGVNLENHFSLSSSNNVKEICDSSLNLLGISYFNYIKIYNHDGSRELLSNNPDWIDHFYKNSLFNSIGAVDVEHLIPKGYFLWSEMDVADPIYLHGRDFFNIDHGITFVIKRKDVTYLYIFASQKNNHEINNFYVGNIDLLQRFIHYFNDKAQKLMKEAVRNRIYLPTSQKINVERENNICLSNKLREQFLEDTAVNRYFLLNEKDDLFLTKKQAQCATFITKGYGSKYIAKQMNISHRTVEGYVIDIKSKLEHSLNEKLTKEEIIQILSRSNIS